MDADKTDRSGRQHPREEIERVRDAHPIEEVVGRYIGLRRAGRRFVGFCPFHDDRRTPSLVAFPESGRWWCFGACNDGGDVFDFVMRAEGVLFPEALRRLGAGQLSPPKAIPPPPIKEKGIEERVLTDAHYALLTTAVERLYHVRATARIAATVPITHARARPSSSSTTHPASSGCGRPRPAGSLDLSRRCIRCHSSSRRIWSLCRRIISRSLSCGS